MALLSLAADAQRLLTEQAAELPQKDDLCGAFWALVTLRAAGVAAAPSGARLDQEAVAAVAGTCLSPPPRSRSRPPGEPGRDDYRLELPVDAGDPGTSAAGVARAIRELSAGRLAVVPVTGAWEAEGLLRLLDSLALSPVRPCAVVANLHTSALWPVNVSAETCSRYLATGDHDGPGSDWSVGHFVALVELTHGARGALVGVADTYPSRGEQGRHRQPVERIAAALRSGGRSRGLLVITGAGFEQSVLDLVTQTGLEVRPWDRLPGPGPRQSGQDPVQAQ